MKIVVVSPADEVADEQRQVSALFEAGLPRYHLRKPSYSAERLAAWLALLPQRWHRHVVLHSHHQLARRFDVLGVHHRDGAAEDAATPDGAFCSRACHALASLTRALGRATAVLFGPVFASLSKPGYGPSSEQDLARVSALLAGRTPAQTTTEVIAIGGITARSLAACQALGFDGAAVLGAVWQAPDPVAAYLALQQSARSLDPERSPDP